MSIRIEQFRSLLYTRKLLVEWLDPKLRPKGVEQMKVRVLQALRHFPPLEENGRPIFSKDDSAK